MARISNGLSISLEEGNKRKKIIETTIDHAKKNNDVNVFGIFFDGLSQYEKNKMLVDDRHPNDYGMRYIANKIIDIINERDKNESFY